MDAQEIRTAVAHQDAARAAAEVPFVNLARSGPRARSGRASGRQPPCPALGGRPGRAVERLALAAQQPGQRSRGDRADPQADRRRARRPVRARQVPGRHHAVLHQPDRPERPERPDPPPGHPDRARARRLHRDDGGLAGRGPPLAGPGPRPSLPGPRPDAGHDPVRELLPLLHAVADRRRPDPELQPPRPRGAARLPAPDAAGPRRPDLGRRRADPRAEAVRVDPQGAPRDPAYRDHPDRHRACRSSCRSGSTTSCARCSRSTTRSGSTSTSTIRTRSRPRSRARSTS